MIAVILIFLPLSLPFSLSLVFEKKSKERTRTLSILLDGDEERVVLPSDAGEFLLVTPFDCLSPPTETERRVRHSPGKARQGKQCSAGEDVSLFVPSVVFCNEGRRCFVSDQERDGGVVHRWNEVPFLRSLFLFKSLLDISRPRKAQNIFLSFLI